MKRLFMIVVALCSMLYAAEAPEVTLSGTVKDNAGDPLEGVTVTLAQMNSLSAETDAAGAFTLTTITSVLQPKDLRISYGVTFRNNAVVFTAGSEKTTGTISLYSGDGRLITSADLDNLHTGQQSVVLPELSSGMYLLAGTVGGESFTRSLVCMGNTLYLRNNMTKTETGNQSFALNKKSAAAVADTIIALKEGYDTTRVALNTYTMDGIAIVMPEEGSGEFTITSTAFVEGDEMPDKYTCEGKSFTGSIAPPLEWSGIPEGTKSLALFFKDLTAAASATPQNGYHWGMWNIPISVTGMPEDLGDAASPPEMGGAQQKSAMGNKFFGPCPDYSKKGGIKDTYNLTLYAFKQDKITPPTSSLVDMSKYFENNAFDSTSISVWSDAQPQ